MNLENSNMNKYQELKVAIKNLLLVTKHLDVCQGTVQAIESVLAQLDKETVVQDYMDMVTVTLMREEGVDKHRAKQYAEHFFKAAQPKAISKQEPAVYQYRMRSTWENNSLFTEWRDCHKTVALAYIKDKVCNNWEYEIRSLYLSPTSQKEGWVNLTDEDITLVVADCASSHQCTDMHFARAIETKSKELNYE